MVLEGDALCDRPVSCRYRDVLSNAAAQIVKLHGTSHDALVLNLGPAWLTPDAYRLFNCNVIEIPFKHWESPAGLGICPLGVVFTVCSSIASWLALNEDNVVVSHASLRRPCTSTFLGTCRNVCMYVPCRQSSSIESLTPSCIHQSMCLITGCTGVSLMQVEDRP